MSVRGQQRRVRSKIVSHWRERGCLINLVVIGRGKGQSNSVKGGQGGGHRGSFSLLIFSTSHKGGRNAKYNTKRIIVLTEKFSYSLPGALWILSKLV